MEDAPPPLPAKVPVFDGTLWKIVLAPLALLIVGMIASTARLNGFAATVLVGFLVAMLACSIWGAVVIAGRLGQTPGARVGWGVLAFVGLQIFYIGVGAVGCTAAVITQ